MKPNSIINPYTFFNWTTKPPKSISIPAKPTKLIPLKTTNALIKPVFNNNKLTMLNAIKHLLPNPTTIFNYLPNKWTLAWYLANSFINKSNNRPLNFSLLTESQENKHVRTKDNSPLEASAEPDNTFSSNHCPKLVDNQLIATSNSSNKPSYSLTGKYTTKPNQRPTFKVKLQVNNSHHKTNKSRAKLLRPIQRVSKKLKNKFHPLVNPKLFTVNNLLIGITILWLTLLTILILKLFNWIKFKRKQ